MNKKVLILIAFIFLLTGCSTEYNIFIDDNAIKEEIISTIDNNEISSDDKSKGNQVDDEITPFINNDQYPFDDESIKYNKKVSYKDGKTIVKLTHNFLYDEYTQSKAYSCFDNHKLSNVDGALEIEFSGGFYCLMGDNVNINIFTDKDVYETNADSVKGNKYTWNITDDNVDNVSIVLKTVPNKKNNSMILFVCSFVIVLIIFNIYLYTQYRRKIKK